MSSGLPPWEAPVMIAEKRRLFFSFLSRTHDALSGSNHMPITSDYAR